MKHFRILLLGILVVSTGIQSCVKEEISVEKLDTGFELNPALATPLIYFNLGMERLQPDHGNPLVISNGNRIISLKYLSKVESSPAGELIGFDPVYAGLSLINLPGQEVSLEENFYSVTHEFLLPLVNNGWEGMVLDSMVIRSARIDLSRLNSQFPGTEIEITMPGLRKNGSGFILSILPDSPAQQIELDNYSLVLSGDELRNNLIEFNVRIISDDPEIFAESEDVIASFNFNLTISAWDVLYGYAGKGIFTFGPESFQTSFSDIFTDGNVYFKEPVLKLITGNSFSLPLAIEIPEAGALTGMGQIFLSGEGVPKAPDYFYPDYPAGNSVVWDSLLIARENSNLVEIISSFPEEIFYTIRVQANPGEVKERNAIYSNSSFSANLNLELPFIGSADAIVLTDTMELNIDNISIPAEDDLNELRFKLYYENSFPADIRLHVYLANEANEVTDTLFGGEDLIIGPPAADQYSEDPAYTSGELQTTIPGSRVDAILGSRYLIGKAVLSTSGQNADVTFFDNQSLFLQLGVVFDITKEVDDF